ncbi:4-hydroxy-tetrahydrodipicolinate reductase [Nonlabens spongiae]|uniref:4-hydroxy-tetrahydrodipicolinate reductase n=1 Tax=Nonlabens spongiae TaxID=331648 RepID=A0A1W6MHP1_9FLAO|nr:4-hydroxy-tetrahydrodipicolinate reductase [Nonlabens spongiae]ARN76999.1 4-hydroxy-tetrahydrodipicolinate reductase [Nonlabens spongiae]
MKIALVGYGKMGKVIERVAQDRGHEIVAKISRGDDLSIASKADAAIEFTSPDSVIENLETLIQLGVPTICGTTGWNEHIPEIKNQVERNQSGLVHASNFSLGVNLFFELNKQLAELMNRFQEYQLHLTEIHHTEKKDAPSGTALSLFEQIAEKTGNKNWHLGSNSSEESIGIAAIREKEVKGTHIVSYESEIDTIEIKHEAHSRDGFALGAVMAAEWLQGKQGVFTMKDVLGL